MPDIRSAVKFNSINPVALALNNVTVVGSASGTVNLDCSVAYTFTITVTGTFTLNLINLPASGTIADITVLITQDSTGGRAFSGWQVAGSTVVPIYDNGFAPAVNTGAGSLTALSVSTYNAGATLLGPGVGVTQLTQSIASSGNFAVGSGDGSGHGALTAGAYDVGPQDSGLLAWAYDPNTLNGANTALTSGVMSLTQINIPVAISATNLVVYVFTAGTSLTSNECWAALYNSSGTRVAVTANMSTTWNTTGAKVMALTGGPIALPAGKYWGAVLWNGTAADNPGFDRYAGANATAKLSWNATAPFRMMTYGTAQTTTPTSITLTSGVVAVDTQWMGIS